MSCKEETEMSAPYFWYERKPRFYQCVPVGLPPWIGCIFQHGIYVVYGVSRVKPRKNIIRNDILRGLIDREVWYERTYGE